MYRKALRIIKVIALGLIVLPEPITTVVGLSILLGAGFLSKRINGTG